MHHGLVLFYAKDRELTDRKLIEKGGIIYKSLPLILFISREANISNPIEVAGKGLYAYKKGAEKGDNYVSHNWTRPLSVISHILGKNRINMKNLIKEKWHLSPIILSYKNPLPLEGKDKEKTNKRKEMEHTKHINNISNLLDDYNVKVVIDHSAEKETENIFIRLKNKPAYVYLQHYLGGRVNNDTLYKDVDSKVDSSTKKIIADIWDRWEKEMLSSPT